MLFFVIAHRESEGSLITMLERIINKGIHTIESSIKLQALPTKFERLQCDRFGAMDEIYRWTSDIVNFSFRLVNP